jgi:phage tail-like protein
MAGETQDNIWPLPKFYFTASFGDGVMASFQEVTGLKAQPPTEKERQGESLATASIKMPDLPKAGNVTLRKGIFAGDTIFWKWYNQIAMNTLARSTVVVSLLDETGAPQYTWMLGDAWPTKVTGSDLKSDGDEVAVESIEIAFETMVLSGRSAD